MKKFLMYVIIVVTCLFLGFTVYYLTQNNENIYITISKDEAIYKNQYEQLWLDNILTWEKPYKTTTLSVKSSDETVVKYDEQNKRFDCVGGGFTAITITPSNENFGPFVFEIYVGDGSIASPYVVDSAEDLALIGNDNENRFTLNKSYILIKDIDLKSYNDGVWTPLGEFKGTFNGNGHTIYNLNVTSGTNVGLFDTIAHNALVEKIKFSSATVNGEFDNAGVVAGVNNGTIGKIEVISSKLTNTSPSGNTGAIVGYNKKDIVSGMVNMCSANSTIISSGVAGGLVGKNESSIVLNSRAIVDSYEAKTASAKFGGLIGINKSIYDNSTYGEETYYASAIKNSFAIVNKTVGSGEMGALVFENDEAIYEGQLFFNQYEGCIYSHDKDNTTISKAIFKDNNETETKKCDITSKTKEEMIELASYVGYDFNNAWIKNASEVASVNFDGTYETYKVVAIGKELTPSQKPLLEFLMGLKTDPSKITTTYRVNEDVVVDFNEFSDKYWTTIAPNESEPMNASIIVDEGKSCVIKNFKLKDANSSFFGYLSGNTIIDGITFENVQVDSCSATNSGIVATGLLNGATLQNITVNNFNQIKTNAENAGIICGYNKGTIKNCKVMCEESKEFIVKLSKKLISAGSIVGSNEGLVDNCTIKGVKFCIDVSEKSNGNINFGGVVGTTTGNVSNSKVLGFTCETSSNGVIYAGGVVGYVSTSSSKITYCYSYADIAIITSNSDAYLGGISGNLSSGTTVKGCFYDKNRLAAYNVGGIVGYAGSGSTIFSSYVGRCTLYGHRVGGLVTKANGKLSDCYSLAKLESDNKKAYLCGLTQFVGADCDIRHNFLDVTFSGSGKYYAESWSEFRTPAYANFFNQLAGKKQYWGDVVKNIIIRNNGAHIQLSNAFTGATKGWISVSRSECLGETGNYSVFKNTAGFDTNIWNFEKGNGFPTLKDVAVASEEA